MQERSIIKDERFFRENFYEKRNMKLENEIQKEYETLEAVIRKIQISSGETKKIHKAYQSWRRELLGFKHSISLYLMTLTKICAEGLNGEYEPEDITQFSCELSQTNLLFPKIDGLFLSHLINDHYKKTKYDGIYSIITEHLEISLDYLGYENDGATIHIEGNCGESAGQKMHSGHLHIKETAEIGLGHSMKNGTILVKNAIQTCGYGMENGTITIQNNAGTFIGKEMRGGSIYIGESYESISISKRGGKIYYKGNELENSSAKVRRE